MTVAAYRDRASGRYPVFTPEIRDKAGALFGDEPPAEVLDGLGLDPVQATEPPSYDPAKQTLTEGEPAKAGDAWRQTWSVAALAPPPVPQSVTMRQARLALSRAGVLKAAEDAIAAMAGQAGEEARIEWDYAAELRRDHPLVTGLGDTLGLDAGAVDDLFRSAASI